MGDSELTRSNLMEEQSRDTGAEALEVRVRLSSRRKSKVAVVGLRMEKDSTVGDLAARRENSSVEAHPELV